VREAVDPPPDRPHRLLPGWRGCAPDRSRAVAERVTTLQRRRWFRRSGRGSGRDVHTKLGLVLPPERQTSSADWKISEYRIIGPAARGGGGEADRRGVDARRAAL